MPPHDQPHSESLGVWDTASLLIGIVVGVSIFKVPPSIFSNVNHEYAGLGVWLIGGVLALCGALCFSELSTTYPGFGGEYQYLSRAYGRHVGFIFAWMQICVILTASIGAMAFVFADYALAFVADLQTLFSGQTSQSSQLLNSAATGLNYGALAAALAITSSSFIHAVGIRSGKLFQNLLTLSKIIALVAILLVGVFVSDTSSTVITEGKLTAPENRSFGLALVFVMYAYGGWNDIAMVTPEVRNYQKNMPRALLLGLGFVAGLYLLLNMVFLKVLGFVGSQLSEIPAADVMRLALGTYASLVMNLIVMSSALGAIHGTTFASSRLLSAIGTDFVLFQKCGNWNRRGVPMFALLAITFVSLILVFAVGTVQGRSWTESLTHICMLPEPKWEKFAGGFDTLIAASAPVFWTFFSLSGFAVIVLRFRDKMTERSFRIPLYPFPVAIFCGSAIFMIHKSLLWAWEMTLLCLPLLLVGIILSCTPRSKSEQSG